MTTHPHTRSTDPSAPPPSPAPPERPGVRDGVSRFLQAHVRQYGMVGALVAIVVLFPVWTSGILP